MIARLTGLVAEKSDDHAILDVNGVGYRVQLSAASLSALPPPGERTSLRTYTHVREDTRELARAVASGDVARLTKVPGIGKKTAERLVLELKEKLVALARAAAPRATPAQDLFEQLEQALLGLGFKPSQAQAAVEALRDKADGKGVDELLREALKLLRQ
jgi:holliday junction DNA helicase RuvA